MWYETYSIPRYTSAWGNACVGFLKVQLAYGRYLFSVFLDLLAGYGYRPLRSLCIYLFIIAGFAATYFVLLPQQVSSRPEGLQQLLGAFVLSLLSFHGRGFFPGGLTGVTLWTPIAVLAALEAAIGLLIEVSFIATFTQRFFGK